MENQATNWRNQIWRIKGSGEGCKTSVNLHLGFWQPKTQGSSKDEWSSTFDRPSISG